MNFTDWSEEITKNLKQAQEHYWKNMAELHAKVSNTQPPETPNMTEGLERLWSLVSPQMPKQADDIMQQVFGMGKGHDQISENFAQWKEVVDSLVESQLHSFGIPTKKAQEELLQQVVALTNENEALKARIKELEAGDTKSAKAAPKKDTKGKAKRISTPAGAKKMPKSTAKAKPLSKAKPEITKPKAVTKPAAAKTETNKPAAEKKVTAPKKASITSKPDDLSKIKGIGPVIQKQLIAAGIDSFAEIAAMSADQAQKLDDQLQLKGRIVRENWVSQASALNTKKA